ncbi:MAG TPA: GNAT family N-acetyltransferase [Candidatus Limnocylindrales bacterium]|nr:GNAT family N-acetyltransferase [Candidatus Limnocylindrales bacterium]
MPLPDELSLRSADVADLPRMIELRESVGWAVHEWALRAVLVPPDARCFVVVDEGDRVVGVGSGIAYGALGFVGNMIVDAEHRRRGIGSAILSSVIDFLTQRGATRLELYATPEGRPLYARQGFQLIGPSTMVRLPRGIDVEGDGIELADEGPGALAELVAYDAPRFGGDRAAILAPMLEDAARPLIVARREHRIVGYGWIRPDAERVGPLLADTPEVAAALVGEAFERLPSLDRLSLNLPPDNRLGAERLAELGGELERWDGRMGRGPQVPRREETIYGMVVGALG